MTSEQDDEIRSIAEQIGRRKRPPQPRRMADVVNGLLAKRGIAQVRATEDLEAQWHLAVGPALARKSRPTRVRNGVLEVIVESSIVLQELNFQKRQLTEKMSKNQTTQQLRDIRFRVGVVE